MEIQKYDRTYQLKVTLSNSIQIENLYVKFKIILPVLHKNTIKKITIFLFHPNLNYENNLKISYCFLIEDQIHQNEYLPEFIFESVIDMFLNLIKTKYEYLIKFTPRICKMTLDKFENIQDIFSDLYNSVICNYKKYLLHNQLIF